jgi:hypothetical protein
VVLGAKPRRVRYDSGAARWVSFAVLGAEVVALELAAGGRMHLRGYVLAAAARAPEGPVAAAAAAAAAAGAGGGVVCVSRVSVAGACA